MAKKKLQVFVAGNFEGKSSDDKFNITTTILETGNIPLGIESIEEPSLEKSKNEINESDIVLLITDEKYDNLYNETEKSITELEYNHALDVNKPVILFENKKNKDNRDDKLKKFISRVLQDRNNLPHYSWDDIGTLRIGINKFLTTEGAKTCEKFGYKITGWEKGRMSLPSDQLFVFVSGAQAVGKTTISDKLNKEYNFTTVLGMDVIRSAMGFSDDLGESNTSKLTPSEFEERREKMLDSFIGVKNRLIKFKKYNYFIIEGVDISPKLCFEKFTELFRDSCVFINVILNDENKHKERFRGWENDRNTVDEVNQSDREERYSRQWEINSTQKKAVEEIIATKDVASKYFRNIDNSAELEKTISEIYKFLEEVNNNRRGG